MVPMTGNKLVARPAVDGAAARRRTRRWASRPRTWRSVRRHARAIRTRSRSRARRRRRPRWRRGDFDDEIVAGQGVACSTDDARRDVDVQDATSCRAPTRRSRGSRRSSRRSRDRARSRRQRSPLSDGAAAVVLMAARRREALGVKPLGYFRAFAVGGRRSGDHGHRPAARGAEAAREDGPDDRRHRPLRDQRGVREPGASTASASSASRRQAQRERRRDRARPPARLHRRAHATALYELGAAGRYAIVTMCIGGGMGAAGLFERAE